MASTETTPASAAPRLQFIDGLRGIAVLMVVFFHSAVWGGLPVEGAENRFHYLFDGWIPIELAQWRHVLSVGGAGVDLFLVISGFCLTWPLCKNGTPKARQLNVLTYLKRRIRRICPPYYAALAGVLLCSYFTYRFQGSSWWPWAPGSFQNAFPWASDGFLNLGTHLLLIHGFFNNYVNAYEGAYWSLSLEWQFYFLFIPLAYIAHRVGVLWAALVPIIVTFIFRALCNSFYPDFLNTAVGHLFSLSRWTEFGAGMLAAGIVSGSMPPRVIQAFAPLKRVGVIYLLASLVYAIYTEYSQPSSNWLPWIWGNVGLALIGIGAQPKHFVRTLLGWRPLAWLGSISYSLYLTHGMVYMAMATLITRTAMSRDVRQAIYLFLGPWLAIAFSALFFRLFEKPFLSAVALKRESDGHVTAQNVATVQDQALP